ncbi:MAG TPA: hypothetical protein EYP14_20875 [Planctomycetaceae bacterium]|nr:hypothetical protein [Planctomycetaceae bacterium]
MPTAMTVVSAQQSDVNPTPVSMPLSSMEHPAPPEYAAAASARSVAKMPTAMMETSAPKICVQVGSVPIQLFQITPSAVGVIAVRGSVKNAVVIPPSVMMEMNAHSICVIQEIAETLQKSMERHVRVVFAAVATVGNAVMILTVKAPHQDVVEAFVRSVASTPIVMTVMSAPIMSVAVVHAHFRR